MPQAGQLPDDLKELAYRNAVELTHARWKSDVQVLLQALRPYLDVRDVSATGEHREDRERETGGPVEEASGEHRAGSKSDAAALNFEMQTMERIIRELAAFIGPISEVVVKRAAKRCSSVEDLYEMAAREIETQADRAKFLRLCRN
jgi:hypothetical protein